MSLKEFNFVSNGRVNGKVPLLAPQARNQLIEAALQPRSKLDVLLLLGIPFVYHHESFWH